MGRKKTLNTKMMFSHDMLIPPTQKAVTPFPKPNLKKQLIVRNRKPQMTMLDSIEQINNVMKEKSSSQQKNPEQNTQD